MPIYYESGNFLCRRSFAEFLIHGRTHIRNSVTMGYHTETQLSIVEHTSETQLSVVEDTSEIEL